MFTLCTVPTPFKTLEAPRIKVHVQYLKVHVHIFISSYTAFNKSLKALSQLYISHSASWFNMLLMLGKKEYRCEFTVN